MDRALFQQVREKRGGEEKNMNYPLNNEILFLPLSIKYIHTHTEREYILSDISHWTLTVFRGMWGCIYTADVSAVKFFKAIWASKISSHWFQFTSAHMSLKWHFSTFRCILTTQQGSGEVLLSQCSLAPAWIPCANAELLIAAPHHASRGSAAPGLGEELRSAQQSYTLGCSALAQGIHTTHGVWRMHAGTHAGVGFYLGLLLGGWKERLVLMVAFLVLFGCV